MITERSLPKWPEAPFRQQRDVTQTPHYEGEKSLLQAVLESTLDTLEVLVLYPSTFYYIMNDILKPILYFLLHLFSSKFRFWHKILRKMFFKYDYLLNYLSHCV